MSIVITTPTGNIGSKLSRLLLDQGEEITVVARDRSKVKDLEDRGAKVVEGSHGDADVLKQATRGARALFLVTPPDFATKDLRGHYGRFGEAAVQAIRENGIGHVVHVSSVGAELTSGTGPVLGLHDNEERLDEAASSIAHLRPAYFMENTLGQIGPIQQASSLFTTFKKGTRFPMIATRDIAERAAELLTHLDWTGRRIVELQGPDEIGYEDVAEDLSDVLCREINHVTVPPEALRESLAGMGASTEVADSFIELASGVEQGRIHFHEPRTAETTTMTRYAAFAREVFKPAFES